MTGLTPPPSLINTSGHFVERPSLRFDGTHAGAQEACVRTRAHSSSDHGNCGSRWSSNNTLSGSGPGPLPHSLLHHVQLLEERRAGTLLHPDHDGCNFLSRAKKRRRKKKQQNI